MYDPFTPNELHHLPGVISAPRFATYLRARGNDREGALALYRWNLEVSAAFVGSLHLCEIAVRNGIVDAIEAVHGGAWPWTQGFIRSIPTDRWRLRRTARPAALCSAQPDCRNGRC